MGHRSTYPGVAGCQPPAEPAPRPRMTLICGCTRRSSAISTDTKRTRTASHETRDRDHDDMPPSSGSHRTSLERTRQHACHRGGSFASTVVPSVVVSLALLLSGRSRSTSPTEHRSALSDMQQEKRLRRRKNRAYSPTHAATYARDKPQIAVADWETSPAGV